jgi:hypothetical protein
LLDNSLSGSLLGGFGGDRWSNLLARATAACEGGKCSEGATDDDDLDGFFKRRHRKEYIQKPAQDQELIEG